MFESLWTITKIVAQEFLLPTLFYTFLFFILALLFGIAGFVHAKKRFPSTGAKGWLIGIGVLYFLVFPLVTAQLGILFSLQRFMGKMLEKGSTPVLEWTLQLGRTQAEKWMGTLTDESVIPISELRKKIQIKMEDGSIPAARIGHPIVLIPFFPQILKAVFWKGTDVVLATLEKETTSMTWGVVLKKANEWLLQEGQKIFQDQANSFYRVSYLYIVAVFLWGGLVQGGVYLLIKKLTVLPNKSKEPPQD
ncbi:MAG: hypothetical protein AABZ60_04130 [Planctomycetota bacterium]